MSRLIVTRGAAGFGVGAAMIDWAAAQAVRDWSAQWIRIDVWTTNVALHNYYEKRGFRRLRIAQCQAEDYPSAALFQKPTSEIDLAAARIFDVVPGSEEAVPGSKREPVGVGRSEIELDRETRADEAETNARRAIAQLTFAEAIASFRTSITLDPGRAERLKPELDFLSGQPDDPPGRVAWMRGVWMALAASSPFRPEETRPVQVPTSHPQDVTEPDQGRMQPSTSSARNPGEAGAKLELAFVRLLERFFHLAADDRPMILERLHRQRAGTQYGHDVQFDCMAAGDNIVRCHVECKNYSRELQTEDVSGKILQMQAYWRHKKIDYFVILTPRASISNDLDYIVQRFNAAEGAPFQIQIWSPDEGVQDLFALEPEAYEAVYGTQAPPVDAEAVVAHWSARLKPMPRVPKSLSTYLTNPRKHCLQGEDRVHFEELARDPVEVQAANSIGVPLGSLHEVFSSWIDDPAQRTLLLAGEFGDGKSFACYQLTRQLARAYRANPAGGYFPLRLPLRDLRAAGNPQELLSRRLQALGSDMSDWSRLQDVARTVVVLDGFDEMSAQLDHATVWENLRLLAECVRYFADSKVLVTSRTHFVETSRDQTRFLEQLQNPSVIRLAPLPRNRRRKHLGAYANSHGLSAKFERICQLYDPIGLAAKPLFLQMIKETLPNLPEDHFDEIVLYETSVRDSLKRKADLLQDEGGHTLREETLQGMTQLLESLALELLETGGQPVNLRTFGGNIDIAHALWKMSVIDAGVKQTQDAQARLGVRSLLKAFPKREDAEGNEVWPVTFCHRSMGEYFVAQAIVRALRNDQRGARKLLSSVILGPEIVRFVELLVRNSKDAAEVGQTLVDLAHSAVRGTSSGYVGGNAITLASRLPWGPQRPCWKDLNLDYADLSWTDLARVDFSGSSLQYAILDNADLSHADFTRCDLTGVRFEETALVVHVGPGRTEDSILACYGDGSIREWSLSGSRPASEKLLDGFADLKLAAWGPYGDLVLIDGHEVSLWEITEREVTKRVGVPIRSDVNNIRFVGGSVSFTVTDDDRCVAVSVDCEGVSVAAAVELTHRGQVVFAGDWALVVPFGNNTLELARLDRSDLNPLEIPTADVTAVDMRCEATGEAQVVLADSTGRIIGLRVSTNCNVLKLGAQLTRQLQGGSARAVAFLSQDVCVVGGMDRSLMVCDWDHDDLRITRRLKLTLRCAGVTTAGVQGDRERKALEALRDRAEA